MEKEDILKEASRLLAVKDLVGAKEMLKQDLKASCNADVLRLFAAVCFETGAFDEGEKAASELHRLNPADPSAYYFDGLAHEQSGRYDQAIEAFSLSYHFGPQQKNAFNKVVRLINKTSASARYVLPAEFVFCTGMHFFQGRFNGHTIRQRGLGGSESALIYMAQEFHRLGHRVAVFCNCDQPGVYDGVPYLQISDFHVYHGINRYPNIIALRMADAFNGDLNPVASHVFWLQDIPNTLLYKGFRFDALHIDTIFVLSEFHKRAWMAHFGLPESRFFITKNGYDPAIFYPIDQRKRRIIYASRPERGLQEAVAAFRLLKKEIPDLEMVLCTYSQEKNIVDDPLVKEVSHLFNGEDIRFLGSLPKHRFAEELRQCLLLFHPNVISDIETSCIAAIEAQACGVPVICGRGGAMEETVRDSQTGLVIDCHGDRGRLVEEIAARSAALLRSPDAYARLSAGAHLWAWENYRWEIIARQWLTFFNNLPKR